MKYAKASVVAIFLLFVAGGVIDADPPQDTASITVHVHLQICEVSITSGPSVDIDTISCGSNGEVHADVQAEAPCSTGPVTYAWQDDCGGTFDDATSATPVWTAPLNPGLDPLVCTLTVTASAPGATPVQDTVHVTVDPCPDVILIDRENTSGVEDGHSWATAFNTIQEGVDAATISGLQTVWVKAGVYDEARSTPLFGVDSGSVLLHAGITILGGFDGTETDANQRDWAANETVIDGSTSRGGQPAHHVLFAIANFTVDGCTIRGGNANNAPPGGGFNVHNIGGGALVFGGDAAFRHCVFENNDADYGGALAVASGNAVIEDSAFLDNVAITGAGGIFNYDSALEVYSTEFSGNAGNYSGAVELWLNTQNFEDCTFTDNTGANAGAVFAWGSTPAFTNCDFDANVGAIGAGAGFHFQANATYNRCTMDLNEGVYGGALSNWYAIPTFTNCLITNSTGDFGGAIANIYSYPIIVNCTMADNVASTTAGGLYNVESIATVTNCILWNNIPNEIEESGAVAGIVTYSTIEGGWPGSNNLLSDPLFAPGGYQLDVGSPCIDTAEAASSPPDDLLGIMRPQGAGVDRGAYESY